MGFIQNWIDRKRRRELERINREIEELKRRGPDFYARDSSRKKPKISTPIVMPTLSGSSPRGKVWVWLVILALLGLAVYQWFRTDSVEDDLEAKEQEALLLRDQLDLALLHLNKTESELVVKKVVEANLSEQYQDLQQEITSLQQTMTFLNTTLTSQIDDLNEEVSEQDAYILALKVCIRNDSIPDKEDCLSP